MTNRARILAVCIFTLGVAACKKETPPPPPAPAPAKVEAPAPAPAPVAAVVSVESISLGNAITAEKRVQQAMESFGKNDTIYAVVETKGSGDATLKAKWTYHKGDKTAGVNESTQTIKATGPAANEFHVSKPDGWPAGDYQVEIFLDDKSAGVKKFAVK